MSEAGENFLPDFNRLCSGTEIPPLFAAWSGIGGVSSVLARRVWVDMGTFTIYPNMYICLVGGSGLVRKSTSIGMIERILRQMEPGPNLIAQKITPEGLIDALRVHETRDSARLLQERSDGFVIVDELATFLNKASYEAGLAALLIPFFDCKDSFEYRTKGGGSQKITNVSLGILAASTVDWITSAIPENAVGGGLTSRIVFVYVDRPASPVARPEFSQEKKELQQKLVHTLMRMSMMEGEMKLTEAAWKFYVDEYSRFRNSEEGLSMFNNKTLSGYASRRHIHQLKLAMIFSASESTDMTITEAHIRGATSLLASSEKYMPMLLNLITSSEQGTMMNLVFDLIRRDKIVDRPRLLRLVGHKIGVRELDTVIDTLVASSRVEMSVRNNTTYYRARDV